MKILMISDVYFPRVNGVSTSIATFRREMAAQGHEVHLIVPDYGQPTSDERGITRIPSRKVLLDPEDRLIKSASVLAIRKWMADEKFDIVHIQTPFAAHFLGVRIAKELGIPRVESYHTFFEEYLYHYIPFFPKEFMRYLARALSRHQCNNLDGMIVPSTPMLEALRAYGIETEARVIPTGLDPEIFEPGDGKAFRRKHGIAENRKVMGFVGRVAFEKNIGFLLEVADRIRQKIPDILLLIAGEGPALGSLKSKVQEMGMADNVMFIGYLDRRSELPACYRAADVFVFASRTETQGLVLLEAMAQGVPVVALAEMGTKDVLKEGEGVLIAKNDVDDFSAKVGNLLGNGDYAKQLGEFGKSYAGTWVSSVLAQNLIQFYAAMIEKRSRYLQKNQLLKLNPEER